MALGLSSCKEEEKLQAKELELTEEVDYKRNKLNELVRKVDKLKTSDQSEKLVDAEIQLGSLTRKIEFEKSEQVSLGEEEMRYVKQLADFKEKYQLED